MEASVWGIDRNRGGQKRHWEKDVEEMMGESVWGTDRNRGGQKRPWEKDVEERMWESVCGIDRNRGGLKRPWAKDVEEMMGESVWGIDRNRRTEETLGEGCGGKDGGECMGSWVNGRRCRAYRWQ